MQNLPKQHAYMLRRAAWRSRSNFGAGPIANLTTRLSRTSILYSNRDHRIFCDKTTAHRQFSTTTIKMAAENVSTDTVTFEGKEFRTVTEGKATILVPQGAKIGEDRGEVQQVFYNPIQQYNRDLSVLAIKTYGEMSLEKRKEQYESRMKKQGKKRKRGDDVQKPTENGANPPPQEEPQATEEAAKPADAETAQTKKEYKPSFRILDALSASGLC